MNETPRRAPLPARIAYHFFHALCWLNGVAACAMAVALLAWGAWGWLTGRGGFGYGGPFYWLLIATVASFLTLPFLMIPYRLAEDRLQKSAPPPNDPAP